MAWYKAGLGANVAYEEIDNATEMDNILLSAGKIGNLYKYTGTSTDSYKNGWLYLVEESYYKFYDVNNNRIYDESLDSLKNAVTYTKGYSDTTKKPIGGTIFYIHDSAVEDSQDKFYVYNSESLVGGKIFGDIKSALFLYDGIGWGKYHMQRAVQDESSYGPWESTTFFRYAIDSRNNNYASCNDWFIGSMAEQNELRTYFSNHEELDNWYANKDIWSSIMLNSNNWRYLWLYQYSSWNSQSKTKGAYAFLMRSF